MSAPGRPLRIGAGSGFSGDRFDPAVALAERGALDYLVFECLAERTIALAMQRRMADPAHGYDPHLVRRLSPVLEPCRRNGTRIVSNMGAANPATAAKAAAAEARRLGLKGVRIAAVMGDDVLPLLAGAGDALSYMDAAPSPDSIVAANAYLGSEAIVDALEAGADIVLTGRVADPSLFLAPMIHAFGWARNDWPLLGRGVIAGHLLECAGQVSGGYFADPGMKDVPGPADIGFPVAEVEADGTVTIGKLPDTGGTITTATVKEQLLYEIHDPAAYAGPDVVADLSGVTVRQVGPDRVLVEGGYGHPRPERLKLSVGYRDGYLGEGRICYGGPGAVARGRLALDIVAKRLEPLGEAIAELRGDLIGYDALAPASDATPEPAEVCARVAVRARTQEAARQAALEVEALYTNGPAGGGGAWGRTEPIVAVASALIDRRLVRPSLLWEES